MAKYFRVTIESSLYSTFSVVYSTNSNPNVFNHTADIWSETTPYVAATNLTYLQLTDNGGLVVVTDDDVYQIKIEDENGYCNDCTSTTFGVAQVIYSLSGIRLDRELTTFNYVGSQNNDLYLSSNSNSGYYAINGTTSTPYGPGTAAGNVYPVQNNRFQSGNNTKTFDSSSGYNFGNPGGALWYSLSGSTGYTGNSDPFGARTSDIAFGMSFNDFKQPSDFGFTYEDVISAMAYLSFTASFATGTNVTMSVAYASDNTNPSDGLNSDWVLDEYEAIEDGSTGLWKFEGYGNEVSFTNNSGDSSWAKPVIKLGS
jgi:hypothetical protein